jgi:hypothetical protein
MGKIPEGAPVAWVLGPDQKFVEVKPQQCTGCGKCGGHDEDDDDDYEMVLEKDDHMGTHTCVICGHPISPEDVTIVLTKWMKPPHQRQRYPLMGGNRLAHFSCGVEDTLAFNRMQDQRVRALQRVDKRLSADSWVRSHKRFRSILVEETRKVLEEDRERDSERHRLLRSLQKVEKRSRKEE